MHKILAKSHFSALKKIIALGVLTTCTSVIFAAPPPRPIYYPDIMITGNSTFIPDNKEQPLKLDDTYFGRAQIGVNFWDNRYEIRNMGDVDLFVHLPVMITGPDREHFAVIQEPQDVVAPGQRTSFVIRYNPTAPGQHHARVSVCSTDPDTKVYDFVIRGDAQHEPLVGPDLLGELVYYKNYTCKGVPRLCTMKGHFNVTNLSWDHDVAQATVRVYVVKGDVLNDSAYLVAQKTVKNLKKYVPAKPGKKPKPYKTKRVKFKGFVPAGYTHIYAEVVPEDGSEDINYSNNRTGYLYGL